MIQPAPAFDDEPSTKKYTDDKFTSNAGLTMAGDIIMSTNRITDLPDPSSDTELVTKKYADANYSGSGTKGDKGDKGDTGPQGPPGTSSTGGLSDTGFTMQGNINMSTNRIIGLPGPILSKEPVTINYAIKLQLFAKKHRF